MLADEQHVLGAADEAQGHHVDPDLAAGLQVGEVLLGDRRQLVGRAGDVQALARGDAAADLDLGLDLQLVDADARSRAGAPSRRRDTALRRASIARGRPSQEIVIRRASPGPSSRPHSKTHLVADLELDGALDERADPQLGTGQVLQQRDRAAGAAGGVADELGGLGVLLVRAVAEVQPGDVHARLDHPYERLGVAEAGPMVATILVRRLIGRSRYCAARGKPADGL